MKAGNQLLTAEFARRSRWRPEPFAALIGPNGRTLLAAVISCLLISTAAPEASAIQIEFRAPQLPQGVTLSGQIIDRQLNTIELRKPSTSFLPPAMPGARSGTANLNLSDEGSGETNDYEAIPSFETFDDREQSVRRELERSGRPVAEALLDQIPEQDGVETIRQRYPDGKIRVVRQVRQDAAGNYFNHGLWKVFSKSGAVVAEGQFNRGRMEGQWRRYHTADSGGLFATTPFDKYKGQFLSVANFNEGKLDGLWTIYDKDQQKIFEVPYNAGQRDGKATWWYPSATKMREAAFRAGVMDGEVLEWDDQGELTRREEYVSGQRVIRNTTFYRPNRKREEQFYLDGKLELDGEDQWWDAQPAPFSTAGQRVQHGPIMRWYNNGQSKMQGQYKSDQREGQFTWWHENGGRHLVAYYRDGEKNGLWTWWHSNGMKSIQGEYKNDDAAGPWTWWDENGRVTRQEDFNKPAESRGELTEPDDQPNATTGSFSLDPEAPSPDTGASDADSSADSDADEPTDSSVRLLLDDLEELEEISPMENTPPSSSGDIPEAVFRDSVIPSSSE